ncbi:MAG: bifunctional diaminohydroxyphosphoribosylaminopyrimidine deaminase/5-amino-6-(5-phosphoribosylamino)uracil reductase RibD [Sandaracinaceae bacterium]|nr:bifunctional diaminohydroxyphosphoribosylaminopyrimidine deaminase/5-amino-6-(5-phosphoribosylamino)uracil reductase RibD [Sandaracinaceae bacterium]
MSERERDVALMGLALEAGRRGRPSPNPHVGAVIARGERVIAVGHHARAGDAHAEVDAIRNAAGDTEGATLYCTLEPCNHFGRTPPCTDAILSARLGRVVIGCADPKPPKPGAIDKLRAAGVEVEVGVCGDEAQALIRDWARFVTARLPWVVLKAAVTLDGRIAARTGDSRWITGEHARAQAHALRDAADAVLVGVGTVRADDPSLDVRLVEGRDPVRVVLDTHLGTPADAKLVTSTAARSGAPTWILHGPSAPAGRRAALARANVELVEVPVSAEGRLELRAALATLAARDVVRVLAEGGASVHGALLREGLAQEAAIFVAPRILGDADAIPLARAGALARIADGWRLSDPTVQLLGGDVLFRGLLAAGPDPSAVL